MLYKNSLVSVLIFFNNGYHPSFISSKNYKPSFTILPTRSHVILILLRFKEHRNEYLEFKCSLLHEISTWYQFWGTSGCLFNGCLVYQQKLLQLNINVIREEWNEQCIHAHTYSHMHAYMSQGYRVYEKKQICRKID
jgi:hypothetical protein